jgi:ABC-type glutathione transport system ATPase component
MHQIELRNITLEYVSADNPVTALRDVSFSVEPAYSASSAPPR